MIIIMKRRKRRRISNNNTTILRIKRDSHSGVFKDQGMELGNIVIVFTLYNTLQLLA